MHRSLEEQLILYIIMSTIKRKQALIYCIQISVHTSVRMLILSQHRNESRHPIVGSWRAADDRIEKKKRDPTADECRWRRRDRRQNETRSGSWLDAADVNMEIRCSLFNCSCFYCLRTFLLLCCSCLTTRFEQPTDDPIASLSLKGLHERFDFDLYCMF